MSAGWKKVANHWRMTVLVLAFALPSFAAPNAFGQAKEKADSYFLAKSFEAAAHAAISRHLDARYFRVFAEVVMKDLPASPRGYLPGANAADQDPAVDIHRARQWADSVSLDVYVRSDMLNASKGLILEVLRRELRLDLQNKDKVTFTAMPVLEPGVASTGKEASGAQGSTSSGDRYLPALVEAIRGLSGKAAVKPAEGVDLSHQLAEQRDAMKQQLETQQTSLNKIAQAIDGKAGPAAANASWLSSLVLGISMLALAVTLYLGAVVLGKSLGAIGTGIAGAASDLARSLVEHNRQGAGGAAPGVATANAGEKERPTGAQASVGGASRTTVEALRKALLPNIEACVGTTVLTYVREVAESKEGLAVAAATLEFIGEKLAQQVFQALPNALGRRLLKFFRRGTYSVTRDEALIDAGERLAQVIFQERLPVHSHLDPTIMALLSSFAVEDHSRLLAKMAPAVGARYLSYLSPGLISNVLAAAAEASDDVLRILATHVAQPVDLRRADDADREINAAIQSHKRLDDAESDDERLDVYEEILSKVSSEVAEKVVRVMEKSTGPALRYAGERHVSLATLFKLLPTYQARVLEGLSVRDIALVIDESDLAKRNTVLGLLSPRRREIVDEDVERVAALDAFSKKTAARAAAKQVTARIRQILVEVPLREAMAGNSQASGISPQAKSRAA